MSGRLPTLRAVQAFEAVGRFGNVAAAARDLGVSSGAVSQHIGRLEDEMGVSLFERRGRNLVLTSWGQIYLERVRIGFDHLRAANTVLQRARQKSGIVVSAPPSLAIRWLRPLVSDWQRIAPGLSVRVIGEDDEPVFEEEQVDFRISYGTARHRYAHFTELFVDRVSPVCSPSFLKGHPVTAPADVLKGPLVGIEWENPYQSPPSWSDWATQAGLPRLELQCELSFSLSSAAIDAAIDGAGYVLGQASMVDQDLAKGKLVVASNCWLDLSEPYALAWNRAVLDRPFGREFRDFISQAGRRLRATTSHF
ncbi:LysR family transcriptional regulator [Rhizobium leguminosarum]|uniref:LysR substrate-binding domain-containing protein n=1 Tax=Rhizobium leguminosarum TaxID=384 RepID=UPI001D3B3C73|nr:LysR substrate-binding domain-containing protein [Rhizobium leguminosarum]MBY5761492.1 LysR family transcriptional regulator [Rhizobium leguminosarum]